MSFHVSNGLCSAPFLENLVRSEVLNFRQKTFFVWQAQMVHSLRLTQWCSFEKFRTKFVGQKNIKIEERMEFLLNFQRCIF